MNQQQLDKMINEKEGILNLAFPALMRKVYVWMTFALAITALTAYGTANSEGMLNFIYSGRFTFMALILAELGLVWYISARIQTLSLTTATLLFILYSALNGITLSAIFIVYDTEAITRTFLITAGTFGVMSFIGYTTKTDLTGLGKMLLMALIGLIIATLVNLFLQSSGLTMILSYVGVLVFVGLTAYDTQKIKYLLAQADDANEEVQKIAILGSLTLYLDFINLFLYLLRIFGRKN